MVTKSKYIGAGTKIAGATGLLALVAWFTLNMLVQMDGDVHCAGTFSDPCEWHYNVTAPTIHYIYNKNSTYIGFDPSVKDFIHCKRDGRFRQTDRSKHLCGPGWREFNWSVPLSSAGSYVEKFNGPKDKHEYKIVVLKHNPSDKIKFGGQLTGEGFDPFFLPREDFSYIEECTQTPQPSKLETLTGLCTKNRTIEYDELDNSTGKTVIEKVSQTVTDQWTCVTGTKQVTLPPIQTCKTVGVEYNGKKVLYSESGFTECNLQYGTVCCIAESQGDKNGRCDPGEGTEYPFNSDRKSTVTKTSFTKAVKIE